MSTKENKDPIDEVKTRAIEPWQRLNLALTEQGALDVSMCGISSLWLAIPGQIIADCPTTINKYRARSRCNLNVETSPLLHFPFSSRYDTPDFV